MNGILPVFPGTSINAIDKCGCVCHLCTCAIQPDTSSDDDSAQGGGNDSDIINAASTEVIV